MKVRAWVGWRLNQQGEPRPMICDHNPGHLAHVHQYEFEIPQDVIDHLTIPRTCLLLQKNGKMVKDCRGQE